MYEVRQFTTRSVPSMGTELGVPFTSASYINPILLMHMDGPIGSTAFFDATGRHSILTLGTVQVDNTQAKWNQSALFNGVNGNYLSIGDVAPDFGFGTGDFTIDGWVFYNVLVNDLTFFDNRPSGTNGGYIRIATTGVGPFQLYYWNNAAVRIIGGTVVAGQWYHIALTRYQSNTKMFLNGAQIGNTFVDTGSMASDSVPAIGGTNFAAGAIMNGWIDEVRALSAAAWVSGFTPPTAPYTVS